MKCALPRTEVAGNPTRQAGARLAWVVVGASLASGWWAWAARAADVHWANPLGGTFSDGANWQGGEPPGSDDRAVFDILGAYAVIFDANATTAGLTAPQGDITFDLQGYRYVIQESVAIGNAHGDIGTKIRVLGNFEQTAGSFTVYGRGDFRATGTFDFTGTSLSIAADATLAVASRLHLWQGSTLPLGSGSIAKNDATGTLEILAGSVLTGNGAVNADTINDGALRPGLSPGLVSPGIVEINGTYTQTSNALLELHVGGLTPGTEHDRLHVNGHAQLDGALEVPIISGFVPRAGDQLKLLTANSISGIPLTMVSPNLKENKPDVGFRVFQKDSDLQLEFVTPTNVAFASTGGEPADWSAARNWSSDGVPTSASRVTVSNQSADFMGQRVNVQSPDPNTGNPVAYSHELMVRDDAGPITVGVQTGYTLAAATGDITIGMNAAVELEDGSLVTPQSVLVTEGGLLKGNGTIRAGRLIVSNGMLRPGFSVGQLDIEGDYQQNSDGTLVVDVEGPERGQFDAISVSGSAELGGTLQIDASNLEGLAPGERIPVLFADSITGEFDEVETIGGDGIQLVAGYGAESLDVGEVAKGDLNADGASFTDEDLELFTLALMVDRSTFVETVHSSCPGCLWMGLTEALGGDFTHDDVVDFSDIPKFMECYNKKGMCVLEGSPAEVDIYFPAVPEPSPGILAMVGVLCAVLAPRGSTCRVKFR